MQRYKGTIDLYISLFLAFSTDRRLYVLKRVIREKLAAPCLSWQSDLVPCRSYRKSSTQSTTPSGPPLPSSLALPRSSSLRPPSSVSRPVATLLLRVCRSRTDTFTTSAITTEHTIRPLRRNLYSGTDPGEYKSLKVPRLDPDDFILSSFQMWKKVTDAVHAKGGLIYCQFWALGRGALDSCLPIATLVRKLTAVFASRKPTRASKRASRLSLRRPSLSPAPRSFPRR